MAQVVKGDEILSAFLSSDPKLWLKEHQAGITRRACYIYEAPISEFNDMLVKHTVLITHKNPFFPTAASVIKIKSSVVTGGPAFPLFSEEYELDISPQEDPVERCNWEKLDNEFVKKAHAISQAASTFVPIHRSVS